MRVERALEYKHNSHYNPVSSWHNTAMKESDWKQLRDLKPIALDRFCSAVLSEVERLSADARLTMHQRYLAVYDLLHRRDKELARLFDGLSRSTALEKLVLMNHAKLLRADELACFSEEVRRVIARSQDG